MRNFIFLISAFILISCAEGKHDFVYGEYEFKSYFKGELDNSTDSYDGIVLNDTLFLTDIDFRYRLLPRSCAADTLHYFKSTIAIPLNKRYDKLLNLSTRVRTSHVVNGKARDTCIRENTKGTYKFSVTEDYIEVVYCLDGSDDCNPKEAFITHLIRPKQYQE